jgi:RNA polymerase sigma-70 factor (ECF subfamily)
MTEKAYQVNVEEAVRKYADMVYRLAVVNTNHAPETDDIFQNVFMELFRHQNSITSEEHLKAWLIRVTINECRSAMSLPWKKRRVGMDALPEPSEKPAEDHSEVTQAVLELPPKYRQVIHLFYYEDLSIREIAEAMHLSEGAVKTRLSRGRDLLKKKLKGAYDEEFL